MNRGPTITRGYVHSPLPALTHWHPAPVAVERREYPDGLVCAVDADPNGTGAYVTVWSSARGTSYDPTGHGGAYGVSVAGRDLSAVIGLAVRRHRAGWRTTAWRTLASRDMTPERIAATIAEQNARIAGYLSASDHRHALAGDCGFGRCPICRPVAARG